MTRTYTARPVWTWKCDRCGFETGDLARQQYGLPSPDVMRDRGWVIADLHGDLCPRCVKESGGPTCDAPEPAHKPTCAVVHRSSGSEAQ